VNAALNAGVKKMMHVSSVAALGRIEDGPVNESMQWTEETSNSKYGRSKYMGEMEVWRGIAEGLNAVIVNPSMILGAGDWNDSSTAIFKSVYNEFPWFTEGTTGFVDVKDVARAMILLMETAVSAERFILSAENKTYHELFDKIADAFNKKRPTKKVTPFIASVVWRLESLKSKFSGKAPLVTKETAATALARATFDNSKIKKILPSFEYKSLDETIKNTCAVLQQKLNIH
jgi:dihydroflavonol-4-reductase